MSAARLTIDGNEVGLGAIWPHWKPVAKAASRSRFSLLVRGEFVKEVFDRYNEKENGEPWESYILEKLLKWKSIALDGCIDTLMSIDGLRQEAKQWVLTHVETVKASDQGIVLEGFAEPFDPRRIPVLKPLR